MILVSILLMALLLSACQSETADTVSQTGGSSASYPPPEPTATLYVYPASNEPAGGETAYPGSGAAGSLDWGMALAMIGSGQVKEVLTQNAPNLTLLLIDGRSFSFVEPSAGAFKTFMEQCGPQCKNVVVK
jgi:PBP1b-binding outer membrane lipoprotein LpoB